MIGTIDIRCSAHNPQIPLQPIHAFKGSPSSIRVLDVPRQIGNWNIEQVEVAVKYPNNKTVVKECVRVGNVWVGTFEGCDVTGKVIGGYEILANGIDEDRSAQEGYVIGRGDVVVLDRDSKVKDMIDKAYVRFLDSIPSAPSQGDVIIYNGVFQIFDGDDWYKLPTPPTKVSELENDVGYATEDFVIRKIDEIPEPIISYNDLNDRPMIEGTLLQGDVSIGDIGAASKVDFDFLKEDVDEVKIDVSTAKSDIQTLDGIVDVYIPKVDVIESLIPAQASSSNKLADKDFVNSSIMTNTAYFKGTFNSVDDLPTERVTPNDYAFVIGTDSEGNTTYNRYKFTADGEWMFEYTLNNSSFTANQWAAINSNITEDTVDFLVAAIPDSASFDNRCVTEGDLDSVKVQLEEKIEETESHVDDVDMAWRTEFNVGYEELEEKIQAVEGKVYVKDELGTMAFSGEYDDEEGGTFNFNLLYVK